MPLPLPRPLGGTLGRYLASRASDPQPSPQPSPHLGDLVTVRTTLCVPKVERQEISVGVGAAAVVDGFAAPALPYA